MKVRPLDEKIIGPLIVESEVFHDHRGFFAERFNKKDYNDLGLPTEFSQINQSRSLPGVLRGLHFQLNPPQGKLVWIVTGKIFDVVVDIRFDSPSFLQSAHLELDCQQPDICLWVPSGFAHGFCVLGSESAEVVYKMTSPYNPEGENGLNWDDSDLKIPWPIKDPILSDRDKNLLSVEEFKRELK